MEMRSAPDRSGPILGRGPVPELPDRYGHTQLTLLVRDPHWLYAFWEITPQALGFARTALGENAQLQLVVRDLGPARFDPPEPILPQWSAPPLEIGLLQPVGDWHLPVPNAGHAYQATIGLRAGRALWSFAESNRVATPTGQVAADAWYSPLLALTRPGALGASDAWFMARRRSFPNAHSSWSWLARTSEGRTAPIAFSAPTLSKGDLEP